MWGELWWVEGEVLERDVWEEVCRVVFFILLLLIVRVVVVIVDIIQMGT